MYFISLFVLFTTICFYIYKIYKNNAFQKKDKLFSNMLIDRIFKEMKNEKREFIICIIIYCNYLPKFVNIPIYYLDLEKIYEIINILQIEKYNIIPIEKKICCECVNDSNPIIIGYKVTKKHN